MNELVPSVDGGRPPMLPWQKALLGGIILTVAMMAYVVVHDHPARRTKKETASNPAIVQAGGQPFTLPDIATPAPPPPAQVAAPSEPAAPPLPDIVNKAVESDILAVGGSGDDARQPSVTGAERAAVKLDATSSSELAQRLTPTRLDGTQASRLQHPDLTILQGTQIPCLQQTAMDSSFNGFVTAIIPQDIRGATGRVVLLEKGTKLFGSMEHAIINGLDRQFVLWIQATTPNFVRITLDSPAADEIGQTGLDGSLNEHIWRKVKGVVMLSLLQGGIQWVTTALTPSNTTSLNFSSIGGNSQSLTTTMLESTINIPDVLHRDQGLACTAFVARDLDFSNVYSLRALR
jgi:type IV secretion system protein VirB10